MRVRIRGVIYETEREAARALGVTVAYINRAIDLGKEDRVGLGYGKKGGCNNVPPPFEINGLVFKNKREASIAFGFRPNRIAEITSTKSERGMAELHRAAAAYALAQRAEK